MANWLHYIGKENYKVKEFIKEATELGVNRAVPNFMLKNIRMGDNIFLATHHKNMKTKMEKATVFGAFIVQGITIDEEVCAQLIEIGVIIKTAIAQKRIMRKCGTYVINAVYTLNIEEGFTIDDLWDWLAKEGKGMFLTGTFYPVKETFDVHAVSFTRGYIKADELIEITKLPDPPDIPWNVISEYKKKR
jgi:hypothetical protein